MSEHDILTQWLGRAARRLRLNLWLREASAMACWLLCAAALYQALRVTPIVPQVLAALLPLFILAGLGVIALFAWRLARRPTLAQAAAAADRHAELNDQLGSAFWFAQRGARTPMIQLLLERASHTVQHLEPRRLFPLVVPRGVPIAGVLAMAAGVLACLSPRVGAPVVSPEPVTVGVAKSAQSRDPAADAQPRVAAAQREQAVANARLDELVRELATDASPEAIAQALGARDAKGAAQLIETVRRRQAAAQGSAATAARPHTEQMSETLAQGILERLQALSTQDAGPPAEPAPLEKVDQPTERLQRELRAEMEDVQSSRPGEQSARENELNTLLRGMSRRSNGGREMVRGETDPLQDAGRTSVGGGGAMGRRIGVSQAGGGSGEQPRTDANGNTEADPVFGKKTQRLAVQLQTVKVEQAADEDRNGAEDAFYAATQAQASKLDYEAVTAKPRYSAEQSADRGRMPLAYREAVKQYMVGQHGRKP
jgi:hypothetical protein